MAFIFKILFHKSLFRKTVWCFQNFLTMEFYRKICNNCYWSNIYNVKHSLLKQSLILFISFVSALFLSFFYLPTDPANSNKSSYYYRIINFITNFRINLHNLFNSISNKIIRLSSSIINLTRTVLPSRDIINLKSSLLIQNFCDSYSGIEDHIADLSEKSIHTNWQTIKQIQTMLIVIAKRLL